MKKRILPLLLAVVLLVSAPGLSALAADVSDYPIYYTSFNTAAVTDYTRSPNADCYYPDFTVTGGNLLVQAITTYHWNGGKGATPGKISIYRWDDDSIVGTWNAVGTRSGQAGAKNVNWDVFPNVELNDGERYYIVDSDPDTWSFNSESENTGFAEVRGAVIFPTIGVVVNGRSVQWTDATPFIDSNSRTMVPLRAVADALGLSVNWNGTAREASFSYGSRTISFPINSAYARTEGGGSIQMDTAAVIVNDRTYAPVRYLAEYFGFNVGWDGTARNVVITGAANGSSGSGGGTVPNSDKPLVPAPDDFTWYDLEDDIPPREATLLTNASDVAGLWKARVQYKDYDGTLAATALMTIRIEPISGGANVTLDFYKIHYEDELSWRDDTTPDSVWPCKVENSAIASDFYGLTGDKLDGMLNLMYFWHLGGNMQYGTGIEYLPDGSVGVIAMVRP